MILRLCAANKAYYTTTGNLAMPWGVFEPWAICGGEGQWAVQGCQDGYQATTWPYFKIIYLASWILNLDA